MQARTFLVRWLGWACWHPTAVAGLLPLAGLRWSLCLGTEGNSEDKTLKDRVKKREREDENERSDRSAEEPKWGEMKSPDIERGLGLDFFFWSPCLWAPSQTS